MAAAIADWLGGKALPSLTNWGHANLLTEAEGGVQGGKKRRVTNTITGQSFNTLQLLAALRSNAPGGWSDNRLNALTLRVATSECKPGCIGGTLAA